MTGQFMGKVWKKAVSLFFLFCFSAAAESVVLAEWRANQVKGGFEAVPRWTSGEAVIKLDETRFGSGYGPTSRLAFSHMNGESLNPGRYIQLLVPPGKRLSELAVNVSSPGAGPQKAAVRSNIDDFAANVAEFDLTRRAHNLIVADLSGVASATELRIYLWDAHGMQKGWLSDHAGTPAVRLKGWEEAEVFEEQGDVRSKEESSQIPFQLHTPDVKAGALYPLVVCLHGAAGRGTDNQARGIEAYAVLKAPDVQAKHPAFLVAPQCDKGFQWVDTSWENGSYDLDQVPESVYLKKVHQLILELKGKYPIDPLRIYVTGQSMGGFGTWDLILRHPELFAAAIPICGGGSPAHAERIMHLPVRFFHGAEDRTVPVSASREMAAALEETGSRVFEYTELPEEGHVIMKKVWGTPGLIDWLFAQRIRADHE